MQQVVTRRNDPQQASAKPSELKMRYRDWPNGDEIVYRSAQPRLVVALRHWFDVQLSDHGHGAMAGISLCVLPSRHLGIKSDIPA